MSSLCENMLCGVGNRPGRGHIGKGGVDPCPGGVRKGRKLCPICPWGIEVGV